VSSFLTEIMYIPLISPRFRSALVFVVKDPRKSHLKQMSSFVLFHKQQRKAGLAVATQKTIREGQKFSSLRFQVLKVYTDYVSFMLIISTISVLHQKVSSFLSEIV